MKLPLVSTLLFLFGLHQLPAQTGTVTLEGPYNIPNAYAEAYRINHAGVISEHAFRPFSILVTGATGAAEPLLGQSFMAFCVSPVFATPDDGLTYNFATNGSVLSYDVDGAGPEPDWWGINTDLKFNALKDIFASSVNDLLTLDPSSEQAAWLNSAIGLAVSEIVMDFDGTFTSFDLATGNSIVTNLDMTPISGEVLTYYQSLISAVGSGIGDNFTLYAAGEEYFNTQDMVFFVPEPGSALMVMLAGIGLLLRRRRLDSHA